jgi:hypothetical protein
MAPSVDIPFPHKSNNQNNAIVRTGTDKNQYRINSVCDYSSERRSQAVPIHGMRKKVTSLKALLVKKTPHKIISFFFF